MINLYLLIWRKIILKTSIAMTTYNGEKYIEQQLKSLLNQVQKPDEVIICDDGSTDITVSLIKNFIKKNMLESSWIIQENTYNKGYTQNFLDCASLTTGDIIFFCDQDDVWHSDKIKLMTDEFKNNYNIKALSCTISVIDEKGKTNNTLFNKIRMGNSKINKVQFSTQVKNNISGGLTLAVRREVFIKLKPIIERNNLPYDVPIGLFTSVGGGYYILGIPLVFRRIHSNNVSAPKYNLKSRLLNVDKHLEGRYKRIELMKACLNEMENQLEKRDKDNLIEGINKLSESAENLKHRKVYLLIKDIFEINPMINKVIALTNILCSLFGDYSNVLKNLKE